MSIDAERKRISLSQRAITSDRERAELRAHLDNQPEESGDTGFGAALMAAWQDAEVVILVDAVRSGAEPGKIHHFDARDEHLPTDFFHYSTHAFSVAEALEQVR